MDLRFKTDQTARTMQTSKTTEKALFPLDAILRNIKLAFSISE